MRVCVCEAHKLCGNIADLPHNGSRSRGGAYAYFYYFMQRKTNRAASVFSSWGGLEEKLVEPSCSQAGHSGHWS